MHVARYHSGTLTFQKEVDPKGEIGHRGELGRYLVQLMRWRGRVDDGRRGPENKKKVVGSGVVLSVPESDGCFRHFSLQVIVLTRT